MLSSKEWIPERACTYRIILRKREDDFLLFINVQLWYALRNIGKVALQLVPCYYAMSKCVINFILVLLPTFVLGGTRLSTLWLILSTPYLCIQSHSWNNRKQRMKNCSFKTSIVINLIWNQEMTFKFQRKDLLSWQRCLAVGESFGSLSPSPPTPSQPRSSLHKQIKQNLIIL